MVPLFLNACMAICLGCIPSLADLVCTLRDWDPIRTYQVSIVQLSWALLPLEGVQVAEDTQTERRLCMSTCTAVTAGMHYAVRFCNLIMCTYIYHIHPHMLHMTTIRKLFTTWQCVLNQS